jgi:hypothetical protein
VRIDTTRRGSGWSLPDGARFFLIAWVAPGNRGGRTAVAVLVELSVVEQRLRAVLEVVQDRLPVTEVGERYGVSRQAVHAWLRRYAAGGLDRWPQQH